MMSDMEAKITRGGEEEVIMMGWDPWSVRWRNKDYENFQGYNGVILKYMCFKNSLRYLVTLTYMEELWEKKCDYGIGADDW